MYCDYGKNRPNAAILGYAVLDKETVSCYLPSAPDAVEAADENTCPCFLFASRSDTTVPMSNSVKMMMALTDNDISYESHIYAYEPHGFSNCDNSVVTDNDGICSRVPHWVDDSIEWLKDVFGNFANQKMTEPKCKALVNGNHESYYNIDCTVGYLMQDKEVMDILMPLFTPILENMHIEEVPKALHGWPLKELLGYMQIPQGQYRRLMKD